MYLLTAELTHPIYDFIRGAIFVDIGDATSSRFGPFNKPNIGVGYGLRIKLPVVNAPIKLDLAFPVAQQSGRGQKQSEIPLQYGLLGLLIRRRTRFSDLFCREPSGSLFCFRAEEGMVPKQMFPAGQEQRMGKRIRFRRKCGREKSREAPRRLSHLPS